MLISWIDVRIRNNLVDKLDVKGLPIIFDKLFMKIDHLYATNRYNDKYWVIIEVLCKGFVEVKYI